MSPREEIRIREFEQAALPHFGVLYRTAAKVICNHSNTEDVVQETFLQAWKSFHRFELGTNCRAWLFKILFRVIHHYRRDLWLTNSITRGQEIPEDLLIYTPPERDRITDEEILAALEKVPWDFREVILLADVQEYSYREIADALMIPQGTVMSRLHRGRKILRANLTPRVEVRHGGGGVQ